MLDIGMSHLVTWIEMKQHEKLVVEKLKKKQI